MTRDWFGDVKALTDPREFPPFADVLPPADYDTRTLDAVDAVLADMASKTTFQGNAKNYNLARVRIRRELGGVQ